MARFKSEFLADYWARHGTSLRARVLAHVHTLSKWGSRLAPLSNLLVASATARWLNEHVLGLDRRRVPPAWASRPFADRFRARQRAQTPSVALFNDTFTNFYNPAVGEAGVEVLEHAGYGVELAPNVCCGRPMISQGLLQQARRQASANTDRLYPLAVAGRPIVFLEPSCLSAVREDAPSLLRGESQTRAKAVAAWSFLFEEFLEGECAAGRATLSLRSGPTDVLLHGHCHQKAMGALQPAKALLARIPGASVTDLDAGCCGMAGSFGYAREHFEVSKAIGERRLLPAARSLQPGSVMVASGVSCRHQVKDFAGTRALHAAELVRSLIQGSA